MVPLVVMVPPVIAPVVATEVTVPLPPLLTVCQVLSPLKNLLVIEDPDPNLAAATVPDDMLEPLRDVKAAPLPVKVDASQSPFIFALPLQ